MKRIWLLMVIPALAHAQFITDKSKDFPRAEIHADTMDDDFGPVVVEFNQKKLGDAKTQTTAGTQIRLPDGGYVNSQRTTTEEKISSGETRLTTQFNETDRQGRPHTSRQVSETVVKTAGGERRERVELKRNMDGQLIPDSQVSETIAKNPDGSSSARRVELRRDLDGKMVPRREIQEQTTVRSPTETVITSSIRSYNRLDSAASETAREETTVRTSGATTQSERIIQQRIGTSWQLKGKVTTQEVVGPTGAIQRETIQYVQPLHTSDRTAATDALQPRVKIIETYTTGADGTAKLQRDVYRRDVNGNWKPQAVAADLSGSGRDAY